MAATALRSEERIGLGVAVAAHVALVALLIWRPPSAPVVMPPDRIEVTLSDDVGLKSTSPEPNAQAAPDLAPEFGAPAPPAAEPEPAPPQPKVEPPRPAPVPKAEPKPVARPTPRPVARPAPRPVARPEPRPSPVARPTARPAARPSPAARPAPKAGAAPAARPAQNAGGTRFADAFKQGVPGAQAAGASRNPPGQVAGPQVRASLLAAITRKLLPHLQGKLPEGADSDKLVTILVWNLNRDGTLAGPVQFIRQEGQTEANRAQWERHKEQSMRAVQLAAPFDLPSEYYDAWKRVGPMRFDKRLAQ